MLPNFSRSNFPDVEVTIKVDFSVSDLKRVALQVEDCHVIKESLRIEDVAEYERLYWERARFLLNEGRRPSLPLFGTSIGQLPARVESWLA